MKMNRGGQLSFCFALAVSVQAAPWGGALDGEPAIQRWQFGGSDGSETVQSKAGTTTRPVGDRLTHAVVSSDGRVWVAGVLQKEDGLPSGVSPNWWTPSAFPAGWIGRLRADRTAFECIGMWAWRTFELDQIATTPSGEIVLGGRLGADGATLWPSARSEKTSTAVLKVSVDARRVLWAVPGAPNQSEINGLAVSPNGEWVYWTGGTAGRGMGAYVVRARLADGQTVPFQGSGEWAIGLHPSNKALNEPGQYISFYKKGAASGGYFDYDGPGGWAPVKFWLHGFRQGGHVAVLPNGDLAVSHSLQYDFHVQGAKKEPAFDLFVARYRSDGRLIWSSNGYQEGDSVHTPDQKDVDIVFNPVTGEIVVAAWQHGSNKYRLVGDLVGDSGNLSVPWVGRWDAEKGRILGGWYLHCIRERGEFDANGRPQRWPQLSGARINKLAVDGAGRIWFSATAGRYAFSTANAPSWPKTMDGKPLWGSFGLIYALAPDLSRIEFAAVIHGDAKDDGRGNAMGSSALNSIVVLPDGILAVGSVSDSGFPTSDAPAWARRAVQDAGDCAIVFLRWPAR